MKSGHTELSGSWADTAPLSNTAADAVSRAFFIVLWEGFGLFSWSPMGQVQTKSSRLPHGGK